jgi:hypothetical protein
MTGDFTVGTPPPTTTTPRSAPPPTKVPISLAASVGPGARISVGKAGARLRTLPAGPVVIRVSDRSSKDNFHLVGPGVNRATSKPGKATVTWKLLLRRGLYTYRSDATPTLRGSFRCDVPAVGG